MSDRFFVTSDASYFPNMEFSILFELALEQTNYEQIKHRIMHSLKFPPLFNNPDLYIYRPVLTKFFHHWSPVRYRCRQAM